MSVLTGKEQPLPDEFVIKASCYHCGNDCGEQDFVAALDKYFCCEGCEMVYKILQENDLGYYYELDANAGKTIAQKPNADKYAYLDNADIKRSVLDFYDNGIGRISLALPQIHCTSCIWLLENLDRLNAGVLKSMVNFGTRRASISFSEEKISLRQLVELLTAIGYEPNLQYDSVGSDKSKAETTAAATQSKSLIYKIGIAGFCFGNAMLLSFPDYLAISPQSVAEYQYIFNYINFGLALPVVFYCATDYFVAAVRSLKQKYVSIDVPLSLGIAVIFVWSSIEIFAQTGTGYIDSLCGLLFFLLTGKWYQQKTYQTLSFERDYKSYFPIAVTREDANTGETEIIGLDKIAVGDVLQIRSQELIPADAVLLSDSAKIDYSFVTGEALPVMKQQSDLLYAGARQVGSSIKIRIERLVSQSYLTQLWNEQQFRKVQIKPLEQAINKASLFFTVLILVVAAATALYWGFVDSSRLALTVTSVLIVACPCALALSMPYTFGNMMRLLGRSGFYLKNTQTVEQLSQIDAIVFDKTGTLSHNKDAKVIWHTSSDKQTLDKAEAKDIFAIVQHSTHPLSVLLMRYLQGFRNKMEVANFEEIASKGIVASINGKQYKIGAPAWLGISIADKTEAVSYVGVSCDGAIQGYFSIAKQYRKDLEATILSLQQRYKLYLLSGDNDSERSVLAPLFGADGNNIYFNQSPTDKLNFIKQLQKEGKKVMMVGDGLNDAAALQQSNVGVAVVEDVNLFSPASDGILDAQRFGQLPHYLQLSRSALRILRFSFFISLAYNIVGLSFAVQGLLTPLLAAILMPLSSVSVVGFVTMATSWSYYHVMKNEE
jgi:P-type Cu+ transporter